jgi:hypothetical protein
MRDLFGGDKKVFNDGIVTWLRERAEGIRRGDRPRNKSEWAALAQGLDKIADAYIASAEVALVAAVALDVLTDPAPGERNEH